MAARLDSQSKRTDGAGSKMIHALSFAISRENLSAARMRIQDTHVGEEATPYARYRVLVRAGTALLAQAKPFARRVPPLPE